MHSQLPKPKQGRTLQMLASHDSERTGPPPHGSRKGWGTPLFPTVLLSVSLSFIVVLIYQVRQLGGGRRLLHLEQGASSVFKGADLQMSNPNMLPAAGQDRINFSC